MFVLGREVVERAYVLYFILILEVGVGVFVVFGLRVFIVVVSV